MKGAMSMSLRLNFLRLFRQSLNRLSRCHLVDVVACWKKWHRPTTMDRFHLFIKRHVDFADSIRITRYFASTFSRSGSRVESDTPRFTDEVYRKQWQEEEEKVEDNKSFLRDMGDTILILARIVVISSIITALLATYLIMYLTHTTLFPIVLRRGIEFLGPIFVKFGQWISTRRDIFSRDVCDTLSQLQHNATPHSWLYTKRLLKATYGSSWRDLFVRFDEKRPIGSGCCAQVYKAWIDLNTTGVGFTTTEKLRTSSLVANGTLDERDEFAPASPRASRKLQAVAVKVLHPGIKGQLKRDIAIMRCLCKCVTYLIPELHWLSLTDCIDEFARIMEGQVDMRMEAANLARFSANFSRKRNIVFPYPYMHLTHRGILVETFHEGSPISDYLEHEDVVLQRKLAKLGITTVLKMVFKDNFIHCDLHPGNILVEKAVVPEAGLFSAFRRVITPDYVADGPRLIILDCGLVASLNDRCRRNLRDVFHSVLMGNGEMAAQRILEHNSNATPDPDGFKRAIKNIMKSHLMSPFNRYRYQLFCIWLFPLLWCKVYIERVESRDCSRDDEFTFVDLIRLEHTFGIYRKVSVSTVVTELFSAMARYRVKQDGSFSSVILSVLVVEGLGRHLDPNIDIFMEILPFIVSSTVYGN